MVKRWRGKRIRWRRKEKWNMIVQKKGFILLWKNDFVERFQ
jgi:hypothetical protein